MSAQLIEKQTWMKCVIVGNQEVGKTCIYSAFALNFFPQGSTPNQLGDYAVNMMIEGNPICLGLWDTANDDDDEDRKQNYQCTDVLLLAFSLVDPESFSNIVSKWNPEVVQYCPDVPKLLVGTKMDLRDDKNTVSKLIERGYAPISNPQGRQVMADIGAIAYVECSGLSLEGIDNLFHNCVASVLSKQFKKVTRKKWKF